MFILGDMEAFHRLMSTRGARRERELQHVSKSMEESLELLTSVVSEIEGMSEVKFRDQDTIENLVGELHSYLEYNVLCTKEKIPYVTSKLGAFVLSKILDTSDTDQSHGISNCVSEEKPCLCKYFECRKELEDLVTVLCKLKCVNKLNTNSFTSSIVDMVLPVVVVEMLQKNDLFSVNFFIMQNENKKSFHYFMKDLMFHFSTIRDIEVEENSRSDASIGVLVSLLQVGLGDQIAFPESDSLQICGEVVSNFVKTLVLEMANQVLTEVEGASSGKHFLQLREKKWYLEETVVQEFLLLNLYSLAKGSLISPIEALALQQKWLQILIQPSTTKYLQNLLTAMGLEAALAGISSLIQKEEKANWECVLRITNVFLTHLPGAASHLKTLIESLLTRALTRQHRPLLASAFLLARQACLTSGPAFQAIFPSYGAWFGATFGAEAGVSVQTASNPTTFSFLIDFLTDLVPTDPPLCLRVHINKVPSAPAQCSHLLADYVSLCKTRLQDLGETTGSGLFAFENTPDEDVEVALAHFKQTEGQISRVLLDSSLFRKTQFEQHFLPALLVPEADTKNRSARQLLIAKLHAARKIPLSLLQEYEMACQHLTLQRTSNHPKSEHTSGSPLEKWEIVMQKLVDTVRNEEFESKYSSSPSTKTAFVEVAAQLKTTLDWTVGQPDARSLQHKVLLRLLKAYHFIFDPPVSQNVLKSIYLPKQIIAVFSPYPPLLRVLRKDVYRLACNTEASRETVQTAAALACMLDVHVEESVDLNCSVSIDSIVDTSVVGEAVGKELKPITQQIMLHTLNFCSLYFEFMDEVYEGAPPLFRTPSLLSLYSYLCERLAYSNEIVVQQALVGIWHPGPPWKNLVNQSQVSLSKWLELESSIRTSQDPLKEKNMYLCDWIVRNCRKDQVHELLTCSLIHSKKGSKEWSEELLRSVSYLGSCISFQEKFDNDMPWLLTSWLAICSKFSHQDILMVVQHFPPWMLLTNSCQRTPSTATIENFADLINNHLIEELSIGGFLSADVVRLAIRAAQYITATSSRNLLSSLIDVCPALYVGILRYGIQLQPLLACALKNLSLSFDNDLDCVVNVWQPKDSRISNNSCKWERGLVRWSRNEPLQGNDVSLYFHLLKLGLKLVDGEVKMVMVTEGPVLPSSMVMATFLVQEPLHCLQLLEDTARPEPISYPAKGLSASARASLSLATIGVLLSLPVDEIPQPGSQPAQVCQCVLRLCLEKWKSVYLELKLCDPLLRDVRFGRWLFKYSQILLQRLTPESSFKAQ